RRRRHGRVLLAGERRPAHRHREDEVLGQPHRLEAQALGLLRHGHEECGVEATEGDPELHVDHPSGVRCQPPAAIVPPSTCRVVPVTNRERSLARYTTAAATSSTWPATGSGMGPASPSRSPTPGVGIMSGAMQFTLISRSPSSSARLLVRLATAAFCAAYTANPGAARWASDDVRLMIDPPPDGISGTASRMKWVTLSKFSRTSACWPFGLTSRNGLWNPPPALFTSTSTRPNRSRTDAMKSATSPGSRTSSTPVRQARPVASTSAAAV